MILSHLHGEGSKHMTVNALLGGDRSPEYDTAVTKDNPVFSHLHADYLDGSVRAFTSSVVTSWLDLLYVCRSSYLVIDNVRVIQTVGRRRKSKIILVKLCHLFNTEQRKSHLVIKSNEYRLKISPYDVPLL